MSTELNAEQQLKLAELQTLIDIRPSSVVTFAALSDYLLASEYELILFMSEKNVWQGLVPPPPPGFQPGDGSIELGLFLYWFNNPSLIENEEVRVFAIFLRGVFKLPSSQMTPVNYTYLSGHELIYVDGSVLSMENFATYDQGWFGAFANLLETFIRGLWYNGGVFPMPKPPVPINLSGAVPNTVKIALVGDWGTGVAAAAAVMKQIVSLKPDYIIHLGDVYYGGTPADSDPISEHYFQLNEEVNNLVKAWPSGFFGKSFTLNSNHEMYTGANGLFFDALQPVTSPFVAQKGMSCFVLQFGGWTILGLDSAFNGSTFDAFMSGTIGDPSDPQVLWIKSLKLNPARTIVLTHHTGFEYDASSVDPLWAQVNSALGADPYAWYWGHAHNGIVYTNPVSIPVQGKPNFTTRTFARCAGHGALPYSISSALINNPNVAWQASSPQPAPSKESYNGSVLLTLQSTNGMLTRITEAFYDPSSANPTRTQNIYPAGTD